MIGQDPGKAGQWFEEGYLVLQLLRLLNEEIESVTWEAQHDDGKGIDCWVREAGRRVAVQCKTRGSGKWTLAALRDKRVLEHARFQLHRDPECRYRLVTDAPCPDLEELVALATATGDSAQWWSSAKPEARDVLLAAWDPPPDRPGSHHSAHALLRRMEVIRTGSAAIEGYKRSVSSLLARSDGDRLLHFLVKLARRSLTRELRVSEVRRGVADAGITIEPSALEPRTHDRLADHARSFVERVAAVRGLERVVRPETEQVLTAIRDGEPGTTVLVHGPAGCGKSEVLAAVVEALQHGDIPVLALLPDQDQVEVGLGDDPLTTLRRHAAGGDALLVIDQLDQAVAAGGETQRRCANWLRRARENGLRIVAGCRTVDAEKETQLTHMLTAPGQNGPRCVEVGDFDEATVKGVLEQMGVALSDLEPPVRRLARRPICLRMMRIVLAEGGAVTGLRSAVELVDRWWQALGPTLPATATEALDDVIDSMERYGLLSAPADSLQHGDALPALLEAGVLVEERRSGVRYLRPFHQLVADVRIAQKWRDVDTQTELLGRLGDRSEQSLHQARRLRLAVPLFLDRPSGTRLLDAVMRSGTVRPLLKRGLLLGLAAIEQPSSDALRMVRGWLDEAQLEPHVLDVVVQGQVAWMEGLDGLGWLDQAWRSWPEERHDRLLWLLGSVAARWGDGVAAKLASWSEDDAALLDRAHQVFLQQPGEDTDALFEMRLEHVRRGGRLGHPVSWTPLLRDLPRRATRLMSALLQATPIQDLMRNRPNWAIGFPRQEELPAELGLEAWEDLGPWWREQQLDDLYRVRVPRLEEEGSFAAIIVELLARCMAFALGSGASTIASLLSTFPVPLRNLDGWLLLRVGAHLPDTAAEAAAALAGWFMSDPTWARLRLGISGYWWHQGLARDFVARIGAAIDDAGLGQLERWISEYRDPWTKEHEEGRRGLARNSGQWTPNRNEVTSFRLFKALPTDRISRLHRECVSRLERKYPKLPLDNRDEPSFFYCRSPVPNNIADSWSPAAWISRLGDFSRRGEPSTRGHSRQSQYSESSEYTLENLVQQLDWLSARSPRRYLAHAQAFDDGTPASARSTILRSIVPIHPPNPYLPDEEWEPVDDAELALLISRPCYLWEPQCASAIARAVMWRAHFPWPDEVVARLKAIARNEIDLDFSQFKNDNLRDYRLNESGCASLDALAALAKHHPDLRTEVLSTAKDMMNHQNPGRRAAAAGAAAACIDANPVEVTRLVLAAARDPLVLAEDDVVNFVFRIAVGQESDQPARVEATNRLLSLGCDSRELVSQTGGRAALALRASDAITNEQLRQVLEGSINSRRGAAQGVVSRLGRRNVSHWLLDLAIDLANDSDQQTGDTIINGFVAPRLDHLAENRSFFSRLLHTEACKRNRGPLIDALDRMNRLSRFEDLVLDLASPKREPGSSADRAMRWEEGYSLIPLLARLVEEAEREGAFQVRTRALDAWDALIEGRFAGANYQLDERIKED